MHPAVNADNREYFRFTGPMRLDKAIRSLEGLLRGVAADGKVTVEEIGTLRNWMDEHAEFASRHPFNQIIPRLNEALADGAFDPEEVADVAWLCAKLCDGGQYFDQVTADMQVLQGIMGGIVADGKVTMEELEAVSLWLDEHDNLRCCWPYDEVQSLIFGVRKDGRIDEREHDLLVTFFREFTAIGRHRSLGLPLNEVNVPITGLCAVCPEVTVADRLFCFTGSSKKATRKQIAGTVERLGGRFTDTLVQATDYLVIGAEGNPCWAYCCYGRKVEQAINHRRRGSKMLLVHEHDFWDAVADVS